MEATKKSAGCRFDEGFIVMDDILDDTPRTPEQRKKLREWYERTLPLLKAKGARVGVVQFPWHAEDFLRPK